MGYSVRSRTYRYTEWVRFNRRSFKPVWRELAAAELYDHSVDPGEDVNVADDTRYVEVRDMLSKLNSRVEIALPRGGHDILGSHAFSTLRALNFSFPVVNPTIALPPHH